MDSETLPIWFTCRAAWCARAVKAAAGVFVMLLLLLLLLVLMLVLQLLLLLLSLPDIETLIRGPPLPTPSARKGLLAP